VDVFVNKFSSAGEHQWARTIGGSGSDYGWSAIQTADGGFAITGESYSHGANQTPFLRMIKLDGNFAFEFAHAFDKVSTQSANVPSMSLVSNEQSYSIVETSDGGYTIAGHTMSFGPGAQDLFVAHIDKERSCCAGKSITPVVQDAQPTITEPEPWVVTSALLETDIVLADATVNPTLTDTCIEQPKPDIEPECEGCCTVTMGGQKTLKGMCQDNVTACEGGTFGNNPAGSCAGDEICCIGIDQCVEGLKSSCAATAGDCEGSPPGNRWPEVGCPSDTPVCCVKPAGR
jgi:hypothetical protein